MGWVADEIRAFADFVRDKKEQAEEWEPTRFAEELAAELDELAERIAEKEAARERHIQRRTLRRIERLMQPP